jgi:hypothetical protein
LRSADQKSEVNFVEKCLAWEGKLGHSSTQHKGELAAFSFVQAAHSYPLRHALPHCSLEESILHPSRRKPEYLD